MSRAIGIDLGTTNSVVAFLDVDHSETIANAEGHRTTPSVVLYGENELIVGDMAKRQCVMRPRSTVRSVKRLIGRRYSEVADRLHEFPFQITKGPNDEAIIDLEGGRQITPEEVSAAILARMKSTAEDFLNEEIEQVVIATPAYFNDSQRTATKKAAELAGFEVLRVVNEPTAAALAYGISQSKEQKIAVFDFGGGTFDISILQLSKGVFEVLATAGDTRLGGDDLDWIISQWIVDEIQRETSCDPAGDLQAMQRIRETAEKVKCELSTLGATTISLPFIVADAAGPKHFHRDFTREQFLELIQPHLDRLTPPCEQALHDAQLNPADISKVLLVGGSTRIPAVQEIVTRVFKQPPSGDVNPDEAVALGAAIQTGIITGSLEEVLLLDVVPLSLGIELAGGIFKALIPRNSSIPTTVSRKFTTVVDNQSSVMVHVLQGERKNARENRSLARLRLMGITPAPREVPEIEVRFHMDANGILQVTAQDLTSGVAHSIIVENYTPSAYGAGEVERALRDAAEHANDDEVFLKNSFQIQRIQHIQHSIQRFLDSGGGQIEEKDIKTLKEGMIRLDLVARAQEWPEIDAIELETQLVRGRYGTEGEMSFRLAEKPMIQPKAKSPTDKGKTDEKPPAEAGAGASTGTGTSAGASMGAETSSGAEAAAPEISEPSAAAPEAESGQARKAEPAQAPLSEDVTLETPAFIPSAPISEEIILAPNQPGAKEEESPPLEKPPEKKTAPKKFTPPAWLFPAAAKRPPQEPRK